MADRDPHGTFGHREGAEPVAEYVPTTMSPGTVPVPGYDPAPPPDGPTVAMVRAFIASTERAGGDPDKVLAAYMSDSPPLSERYVGPDPRDPRADADADDERWADIAARICVALSKDPDGDGKARYALLGARIARDVLAEDGICAGCDITPAHYAFCAGLDW